MAETNEFDAYWDDKLSQRNLEVGGIDVAKGIAGAAVKGTGSLISNLSAGDIARGARGLVDPTMNKVEEGGVIDTALTWLNDTFDPEGKERQRVSERVKELQDSGSLPKGDGQNKDLTVAALPGLSALAEPLKGAEVIGDIADKAIKPTAKFIGEPIKEVGQGIIESTSPDMQEAMSNPELFKGGQLGRGAGDPAAWAGVAAQAVGSLIPTVATAAITKNPTAGLGVGMGMSVGQAGDGAYETAINSNPMDLIDSPIFVGELKKVSQDPEFAELDGAAKVEEAQRRYAELSSSMAKSKPETIAAAAMGTMLGDATIVKTMLGSGAGGAVRGMLKGAATEAPGEFGEEWLQRYVGNTTQNQMASKQLVEPMAGTLDAGLHGAAGGVMAGGAMGGAAAKFAKVLHANKDNLTPEQAVEVVERSMKNRGVDDATARQVAEQAAGMMTSPDLEAAVDGLADPPQASSDQNPLGPSASQFDELRDVPAYLRQDDTADRYKGMAADSEVQRALAGEFGQTVQELVASQMKAGDQGKSLYERAQAGELGLDPFAGNKSAQQVAMENQRLALPLKDVIFAGDANAKPKGEAVAAPGDHDDQQAGPGPQFRGGERTSWQSGQEGDVLPPEASSTKPAGELPGAVIEGEAREVGNELPHRNVVYGNDLRAEQQRAADLARRERELNNQPLQIGQSDTIFAGGTPGADPRNSAYTPPRLSRDQVDTSMGEQSTRDPRSPVAQSIEQAGSATDSVFGPLQTLRITRKGKPFATEKEAAMASRKGQEMPVPLNGGGFGVAEIAEVERAKAAETTQPSVQQLDDISVTDPNQPSDQPVASVSAETVPAPSATAGEASQLVPAIDTGYREVIPGNQPQVEVSNEPVTPIPAISSERSGDQPGAGEPAAAGAGPAVAGLTDRAGSGDRADLAAPAPVPDGQQQNDPTLTAPATDAGAAVSGRIGEEELRDRDLLKEHGGHWKYRSAVGAGWFTANTKEAAIERAEEAYRKAVSKGEPVPTRDERFAQADAELFSEMDRRYGKMSTPELEAEYQRLGGEVGDLQKSGSGEFNGNGGRRTGAAVSNEGARQVGEERLRLGVYMKMRRDRDTAGSGAKSQQIEPANDWRGAKSATDYHAAKRRLFSGEMEFSEFQAMSRSALDNAPSLRAELEKKTKQDLLDQMSRFNAARYKNDKKAVVVDAAYNQLIGDLRWAANGDGNTISETYAIGGARQSIEERVAKALDGLTPERYQQFVNKQRADVAKRDAELAATKEALRAPQTLEQFKTFLKYRSLDKLTPEQRARYEDLIAASNLDKRDQAHEVKAATAVTPTASGDIIKTKHTKSGEDLFVVQMGDRVDRDTYNQINAHAKKLGGWYSSYKVGGAVPGFQFKDEAKATEFRGWLTGQGAASAAPSAEAAPTEVTDPDQDNSKSKQVETLRTRAKTLRDKATAALNAERKENTNKRMTEAANARANAESELHFAGLLDAIADGIESGEVTYLRNLANGTQLTELNHALSRSLWNLPPARREALTSQGMIERTEDGRERWSAKATPEMMAEGAQMPGMDYFARNLKDVATKMQGASGFKQAGAKIMALVNAAINRDSKTVSITDPELIAKLKAYTSGVSDYDAKAVKEQINGYSRLERMGITNHTELRAALRELARLQAGLKKQAVPRDPLAEKMVALKRKLVGNRNAFIDFFPTPESHAADLVALAGIEPGMTVLEPSAGHGMLAEAARAAGAKVDAVELAVDLREILQAKGFGLVGGDFMDTTPAQSYDAVVMNPPFSNDMDIDHVRHAYDHLKPGGRLVAIVSATAGDRQNNKNKAFREWFDGLGGSEQAMPDGAFKASLNPTDVRTKIFVIDKPANEVKPLPSPEGKRVTVATPKGQSVEVQYRVMEAADLVASHDFEGNINHDYPQQLQPRDRSKQTYRVQVGQIAAAPEGARLAASPETDRGAPIVRDGIVESGNGRTIGLKQAYQRGDAGAYRAYLLANATEFGLDAAAIEAMSAPVLVRERLTEMDDQQLRDFVVDSNTDAKMANSATEDARADAGKLTTQMLNMLNIPDGGDVLAAQNHHFLQAFLRAIGENQSNSYVNQSGGWNAEYGKRVKAAIFAYGYDNQRLLDAVTGETDEVGRNMIAALLNNAVAMAQLRQHSPERAKSLANYLAEAVESVVHNKRSGQSLQELAAQGDMLGGGPSTESSLLAQAMASNARSAKAMTEMIGDILAMMNKTPSNDMFGEAVTPITAEEAIRETLRAIDAYNQQRNQTPRPSGDLFGLAAARNDHGTTPSVSGHRDGGATESAADQGLNAPKWAKEPKERHTVAGISFKVPVFDKELQKTFNEAVHRGEGRNFAQEIQTVANRLALDLEADGLLATHNQRVLASQLIESWVEREIDNAKKTMAYGIANPSWMVTGTSGNQFSKRRQKSNLELENERQADHEKAQEAAVKRMRAALKELQSPEAQRAEAFKLAWRDARAILRDLSSYLTQGKTALLAELRKSGAPKLAKLLGTMAESDPARYRSELRSQDQRFKEAGMPGLIELIGARTNAGKIISDAINGRIRFSKQAMAQGDKPAKHLTRKEAELVTKEWFKQYRGASGIKVQIHATQAELEQALGLDAQAGLIRRAAFDDDTGTLHVAADTIADPKRMREILRHEVLAHYGLAKVLGDGEYTKLMSRLIQSQKDPSMKPVWDWVNTHYADEDIGTKAEEVVAHLAELEQGAWGRGWDRVVAWVTRALRAVGFVPDGITAAETRSLIEGLGKQLQRTGQDDGGSGGKKFSQEEKPGEDTFKPYPGEAEEYRRQLGKMMASPKSGELVIEMGHTPLVLQAVGAPDLPLRITRDIVRKATNGVKHDVPMPVIEQLPELLHDPIAVFDSKTEQGAKTILIDARDASGRPIITAVHLNAKAGRIDINRIASVYGKDNSHRVLMGWVEEGLLRYAKEKQNPLGTTQGLQLPKRGSPERVYGSNILSRGDLAKDADKIRDRVAAAGQPSPSRGKHESTRDDGSLPPDGLKFSQTNSAADSGPALEQSLKQKAAYQAGAALGSVKNWMKQGRPVMLGALTDLQIDQVYRDITGGAVSEYQRLRTQMEADRNDILLDAETRIDPLWDALGKQEKADLSNLMHDATMARLHPDKSLDENSYYQEAKQKLERAKKPETRAAYEAELHIIERNHSELARQYQALTPKAKALYDTMQDTYTKQWESLRGAIEQRLEDLLGVNQGRAMAAEMRQKMEHALQHGPYFPLTRYGDYVVKARKGDEYVREHFERRADAEQAVKQYQRDGYNAVMTVKEEGGGDSANANQLGMEMLSFLDSADGVSKSALKDEIWQAMLRMMPDASYAKHAIHRRRVKGASRDAHRAYLNSVYHYARHVSKIRYGHKMQGELDKLSEQIRAGVAGEPSSLKPEDLEIAQQVLNEMNKRHDLNMNPTGKAWAGSAGNIGFLYYIGPSVASAVVNMTQNFTVMLPQLGAKYGFAKSAAAMTQALGDYVKHGKFKAGTTEAWHSLTRSTTLPADERAILDRLYRAGALDLTQAHSIAAKADTDQQDAKPMGKRWRRAMRWAGATFHNAEVLNREVAALAAYRLLKQAEPTLNGQQYADRVAEMVYDGHGNYAASNRSRYMRNDITKVLTQFKIYSQMMTYVLYSNAIKAAKGDKVAQKTLAGVLATHWVMAGVMGLPTPITAVVYAIAAGLDDDDDRSGEASFRLALTEALGPRAGELLAKGPMDALTNLSIAGRTGLGDLWWRSPKEGTEGDDLAWHAVQQLLGPVAGIGINLARGAGQMTDGHIQRGLETMLPKSIRDVAKSYRQATEGEQTIKGDIIMDDVSTWNVAMQGLGFGSAQMAKNYDAREYIKGKEKRIADKRSQLLTDYYMARKSGEMDEVQEVLERIKMFNSIHHPRERITGKSLALSFKSKLRSNERTQGGVYLNRNREYLREEGRFAD